MRRKKQERIDASYWYDNEPSATGNAAAELAAKPAAVEEAVAQARAHQTQTEASASAAPMRAHDGTPTGRFTFRVPPLINDASESVRLLCDHLEASHPITHLDVTALSSLREAYVVDTPEGARLLARLRAALLRHVPSLIVLKITGACICKSLFAALRASHEASRLQKVQLTVDADDYGLLVQEHTDRHEMQKLWDDLLFLNEDPYVDGQDLAVVLDLGQGVWPKSTLKAFMMRHAPDVLPFTSIAVGDHEGLIEFDSDALNFIATRCWQLKKLELHGPCVPPGSDAPCLSSGFRFMAIEPGSAMLVELTLFNVRVSTADLYVLIESQRTTLKKMQLSFSLVTKCASSVLANAPLRHFILFTPSRPDRVRTAHRCLTSSTGLLKARGTRKLLSSLTLVSCSLPTATTTAPTADASRRSTCMNSTAATLTWQSVGAWRGARCRARSRRWSIACSTARVARFVSSTSTSRRMSPGSTTEGWRTSQVSSLRACERSTASICESAQDASCKTPPPTATAALALQRVTRAAPTTSSDSSDLAVQRYGSTVYACLRDTAADIFYFTAARCERHTRRHGQSRMSPLRVSGAPACARLRVHPFCTVPCPLRGRLGAGPARRVGARACGA